MKFEECFVGQKVVVNAQAIGIYKKNYTEGKEYVVHSLVDNLIRVEDDEGTSRAMLPARFNPAIIYNENLFYVGDIVKRKERYAHARLGEGELRIAIIHKADNTCIRDDQDAMIVVERLDGVPIPHFRDAPKKWAACRFDFIRHQGPAPKRVKVDGVFEVGDEVTTLHAPNPIYIIAAVFPKEKSAQLKGMGDNKYGWEIFKHAPEKDAVAAKPKPPELVWPELDEGLMKELADKSRGGVCNYATKKTNGEKDFRISAACHAGLGAYGVVAGKVHTLACNVSSHYKNMDEKTKANYTRHTEYILKESPWAPYFHERPLEKVLEGGVFLNVENPHSYVVTAAIALRMGHEHNPSAKMNVFARVIDLGYNKHIAFIVAHTTQVEDGKVKPWYNSGWHHCINSEHNAKSLCEFFQNGYTKGKEAKHTKDGCYGYTVQETVADHSGDTITIIYKGAKGGKKVVGKWGEEEVAMEGDFDSSLKALCDTLVPFFK